MREETHEGGNPRGKKPAGEEAGEAWVSQATSGCAGMPRGAGIGPATSSGPVSCAQ